MEFQGLAKMHATFEGATLDYHVVSPQGMPVYAVKTTGKDGKPQTAVITGSWETDSEGNETSVPIAPVITDAEVTPSIIKFRNPKSPDAKKAMLDFGLDGADSKNPDGTSMLMTDVHKYLCAACFVSFKDVYFDKPTALKSTRDEFCRFIDGYPCIREPIVELISNAKNF